MIKIRPLCSTVILMFHSGYSSPVEKVLCHADQWGMVIVLPQYVLRHTCRWCRGSLGFSCTKQQATSGPEHLRECTYWCVTSHMINRNHVEYVKFLAPWLCLNPAFTSIVWWEVPFFIMVKMQQMANESVRCYSCNMLMASGNSIGNLFP